MRKTLIISLVLLTAMFLSSCAPAAGPSAEPTPEPAPVRTATPAPVVTSAPPTPEATPEPEQIKIIVTTAQSQNTRLGSAAADFAEALREELGSRVFVTLYDSGSFYDEANELRALGRGEIQLCVSSYEQTASSYPELRLLEIPFLFPSRDAAYEMLGGKTGEAAFAGLHDARIEPLGLLPEYRAVLSNNVRPLQFPSDFRELTLSFTGGLEKRLIEAFGCEALEIPTAETYAAIQLRKIDGLFSAARSFVARQYGEVQRYATDCSALTMRFSFILASTRFLNSLPEDVREGIERAARTVADTMRRDTNGEDAAALERITEDGTELYTLSGAAREAWLRDLSDIVAEYEQLAGTELVALARREAAAY